MCILTRIFWKEYLSLSHYLDRKVTRQRPKCWSVPWEWSWGTEKCGSAHGWSEDGVSTRKACRLNHFARDSVTRCTPRTGVLQVQLTTAVWLLWQARAGILVWISEVEVKSAVDKVGCRMHWWKLPQYEAVDNNTWWTLTFLLSPYHPILLIALRINPRETELQTVRHSPKESK